MKLATRLSFSHPKIINGKETKLANIFAAFSHDLITPIETMMKNYDFDAYFEQSHSNQQIIKELKRGK
jgi:K+-sensing histidine kinase KdpD